MVYSQSVRDVAQYISDLNLQFKRIVPLEGEGKIVYKSTLSEQDIKFSSVAVDVRPRIDVFLCDSPEIVVTIPRNSIIVHIRGLKESGNLVFEFDQSELFLYPNLKKFNSHQKIKDYVIKEINAEINRNLKEIMLGKKSDNFNIS